MNMDEQSFNNGFNIGFEMGGGGGGDWFNNHNHLNNIQKEANPVII